jgi:hypothetical protein
MPMKRNLSWLAVLLWLAACASKPAVSTAPPSGTWSGDYGPDAERRDPVTLDLRWEEANLRGAVRAGPRSIEISKAAFTPETGNITLEFDAQGNNGQTVHYVIEGKLEGDAMSGSWSHDNQRGDFRLRKR